MCCFNIKLLERVMEQQVCVPQGVGSLRVPPTAPIWPQTCTSSHKPPDNTGTILHCWQNLSGVEGIYDLLMVQLLSPQQHITRSQHEWRSNQLREAALVSLLVSRVVCFVFPFLLSYNQDQSSSGTRTTAASWLIRHPCPGSLISLALK